MFLFKFIFKIACLFINIYKLSSENKHIEVDYKKIYKV